MRLRPISTLVVIASMAAAAWSSSALAAAPTNATPTATCNRPHPSGQFSQTFTFQGATRTDQLYVPPAYTGTKRVPLVFDFHGYGSNAVEQMIYGNFKPQANANDFLIVAPDGQSNGGGRHFNLTGEKGLQNDIAMVSSLMSHLEATLCIDASRVYSTGMSDGGATTSVLACLLPNKFAAFAAVAVIVFCGSKTGRAVAIEAFSGTADPVVPFNGGQVSCCGHPTLPAAPASMAAWAAHDHCATKFTDVRLGSEVRRRTWSGCKPGSAAVFYIIDGGGHTWPGSIPIASLGLTTQQIKASDVIWKFFAAHKLTS
jgi:polyhydroxybutyrate depolymerase